MSFYILSNGESKDMLTGSHTKEDITKQILRVSEDGHFWHSSHKMNMHISSGKLKQLHCL